MKKMELLHLAATYFQDVRHAMRKETFVSSVKIDIREQIKTHVSLAKSGLKIGAPMSALLANTILDALNVKTDTGYWERVVGKLTGDI